ncbi:protein of unknown function DUF72 [Chthoniobacter flavus Ellin428]|uniref:DUF72 domain-containing protein n=1 Tax=Chthoniobacter flavus Ellin428 TaxID=497964 RepID=B4CUU7_9BACT|nr:protein of unknown function DUF72 [Chthoniobacter flavus Ellin428]
MEGEIYPVQIPASRMLAFYADHFSTTEINYSFRRIPAAKTIQDWSSKTPAEFRFSFKAPQRVTHFAKLRGCAEILEVFAKAIAEAGAKMGPVLFQLPPTFVKDVELLRAFLGDVPNDLRMAFEFRHPSWFDDAVFEALRGANAALCIAENEELATPAIATADFGYLRLRREDYTAAQLRKWAAFVDQQKTRWSKTFVYFKHEECAVGPKFAHEFRAAFSHGE